LGPPRNLPAKAATPLAPPPPPFLFTPLALSTFNMHQISRAESTPKMMCTLIHFRKRKMTKEINGETNQPKTTGESLTSTFTSTAYKPFFQFLLCLASSTYALYLKWVTMRHTYSHYSSTPLDERSARHRDRQPYNIQHSQETHIHAPCGIRTESPPQTHALDRADTGIGI
jgi:hypothetical protein